eukprot:TRINITY_DN8215_c0_g1_i2.p1 TRINITY_DN8215_c0_g1~~TRINITY_DN8215_c0_g1_i2.p1  ORF type:complete len:569 (+),score=121.02 TRINITY_DN8215_c0_g1_i2:102-1808(+)
MAEGRKPFARAATISSGTPLSHRDKTISKSTRERFEALDLETLLSEFQRVASEVPAEEEEEDIDAAVAGDDAVIEEQQAWLQSTGFDMLAQQFQGGKAITDEDFQMATAGYTASQRRAVASRAKVLNSTLSKRQSKAKPDARTLFEGAVEGATATASPDAADSEIMRLVEQGQTAPTRLQHLSEEDRQQLKRLCLIQLTSLFESSGISSACLYPKKKKKKKKPVGRVFGGNLVAMTERDTRSHPAKISVLDVPVFVIQMVEFLRIHGINEEGLFRKAGSAARIKGFRDKIEEAWGEVDLNSMGCRTHDIAAAFKQFFRETHVPLLTDDFIEAFSLTQDLDRQLYGLQLLVAQLPKAHAATLKVLLDFLMEVADKADVNKMTVANLAVVFAPTLFYMRGSKGQQMLKEVELQVTTASTLKTMLLNHDKIWHIPGDMMAQMRFVNDSRRSGAKASKPKQLKRLLTEKKLSPPKDRAGQEGMVLWVSDSKAKPPVRAVTSVIMHSGAVEANVQITELTTADDILKLTHSPPGCALFECGGNINRRQLDATALVLPVLKVNPAANIMAMTPA